MADRVYVLGAGGAGREVAALCERLGRWTQVRFVVDVEYRTALTVAGRDVLTIEESGVEPGDFVVSVGDPFSRPKLARRMVEAGHRPTVVSACDTNPSVTLGGGTIVAEGAVFTTDTVVGEHCYINVGATVSHDVTLGDHVLISPGVTVCGWVQIGDQAFIGAGATIINGSPGRPLRVGAGAFVAAGSCVVADVAAAESVAGVPARPMPLRTASDG